MSDSWHKFVEELEKLEKARYVERDIRAGDFIRQIRYAAEKAASVEPGYKGPGK